MSAGPEETLPDRSAAWGCDSEKPSQAFVDSAVRATLGHELAIRARQFAYCHAIVMVEPKSFIERCKWEPATKNAIFDRLSDTQQVTLVSYQTSSAIPQPLSGGGETFDLILHPESLEVLFADVGYWKS